MSNPNTIVIDTSESLKSFSDGSKGLTVKGGPHGAATVVSIAPGDQDTVAINTLTVLSNATVSIRNADPNTTSIYAVVVNGGTLQYDGSLGDVSPYNGITIGPKGGTLVIEPSSNTNVVPVYFDGTTAPKNFRLDLPDADSATATYYPDEQITTLTTADGRMVQLNGNPFHLSSASNYTRSYTQSDGQGGVSVTCFLAGAQILTPSGLIAVENLRVGDSIVAHEHGGKVERRIVWVGKARAQAQGPASDRSGHPVRIQRHAIADNVPFQDLLVTAEHCLVVDDAFVPVRMLVNGSTIAYDATISEYDYFHIETEAHCVISANDVLTESFLDTGHQKPVMSSANLVSLRTVPRNWGVDSALPLRTDEGFVKPVFARLAARAEALGHTLPPVQPTTQDPDLLIELPGRRSLRPARVAGNRYVFQLPAHIDTVHLLSRTSRPCDGIGPFVDDRRELGVLVKSITLFDSDATRSLDGYRTTPDDGWHPVEHPTLRWTRNRAPIALGTRQAGAIGVLCVEIEAAGPYLVAGDATVAAA